MKAWRKSGYGQTTAPAPPPTGPLILSVQTDGSQLVIVTFDQTIAWDTDPVTTLIINGLPGTWNTQPGPDQLEWDDAAAQPHDPNEPWSMPGPELHVTPTPQLTQSGTTT